MHALFLKYNADGDSHLSSDELLNCYENLHYFDPDDPVSVQVGRTFRRVSRSTHTPWCAYFYFGARHPAHTINIPCLQTSSLQRRVYERRTCCCDRTQGMRDFLAEKLEEIQTLRPPCEAHDGYNLDEFQQVGRTPSRPRSLANCSPS
jgi:hypothetical protein